VRVAGVVHAVRLGDASRRSSRVLACWLLVSALALVPTVAEGQGLQSQADTFEQSAALLVRSMAAATKGSTLGVAAHGNWLFGQVVWPGRDHAITYALKKSVKYAFCLAAPSVARSVAVGVLAPDGTVVAKQTMTPDAPCLAYTPAIDATFVVRVAVRNMYGQALCLLAVLEEGGVAVDATEVLDTATALAVGVKALAPSSRRASLNLVIGAHLEPGGSASFDGLAALGEGRVQALAVGAAKAHALELALLGAAGRVFASATGTGPSPHVALEAESGKAHGFRVLAPNSPERSLVIVALLRAQ
jgi:hypothetical protein